MIDKNFRKEEYAKMTSADTINLLIKTIKLIGYMMIKFRMHFNIIMSSTLRFHLENLSYCKLVA